MDNSHFVIILLVIGLIFSLLYLFLEKRNRQSSGQIISSFLDAASIPSFRYSIERINKELSRARRLQTSLSIIVIKHHTTNSTFSNKLKNGQYELTRIHHQHRDASMTDFLLSGKMIRDALREMDIISYAATNQQYIIVLPDSTKLKAEDALTRIKKVVGKSIADQFVANVAEFPNDGLILEDLVAYATNSTSGKDTVTQLDRQVEH